MMLLFVPILLSVMMLLIGLGYVVFCYKIFVRVRIDSLCLASQVDSVGGVEISMLCVSPEGVGVVVNLLSVEYPRSEVVVAVNRDEHLNLIAQLQIRYSLVGVQSQNVVVYRSGSCSCRRLVVVVSRSRCSREVLLELSAQHAAYNYLFVAPSTGGLLPYAIGVVADVIASESSGSVDVLTTLDRGVVVYSRQAWRGWCGGKRELAKIEILEPLVLDSFDVDKDYLLLERSRYNFLDFLSLNIMRYRNKLLSLVKP